MLGVLKYHKDTLVLEHDLAKTNNVATVEFAAQTHLTDRTLRDTWVADLLSFRVWLGLFDG